MGPFPPIADTPAAVHGDLPAGAVVALPAALRHPQVALVDPDHALQRYLGEPIPSHVHFGHQARAHPLAPHCGEGSLNRPDSKGKLPERLERKYMSHDENLNNKNQVLRALYGDLLELKTNYQVAVISGRKKEAQYIRKNYDNAFRKAEALRRDISSNGASPVPQPKRVTKDPS